MGFLPKLLLALDASITQLAIITMSVVALLLHHMAVMWRTAFLDLMVALPPMRMEMLKLTDWLTRAALYGLILMNLVWIILGAIEIARL